MQVRTRYTLYNIQYTLHNVHCTKDCTIYLTNILHLMLSSLTRVNTISAMGSYGLNYYLRNCLRY